MRGAHAAQLPLAARPLLRPGRERRRGACTVMGTGLSEKLIVYPSARPDEEEMGQASRRASLASRLRLS